MMRQESRLCQININHKNLRLHTNTWTPVENQENAAGIRITRIWELPFYETFIGITLVLLLIIENWKQSGFG